MESLTIRVGFKGICAIISKRYIELFYKHLPEQLNLKARWEVAISVISNPTMYQNVTEKKFMFFDKKLSLSSEFYYLEPGLYPSVTDIVEAMNILIQERHNHSKNCITLKVSRKAQEVEIYFANERSGLALFSTDLGHNFGSKIGKEFEVMLRGKGPHKLEFADHIVHLHSLMIYTDLIEYKINGDAKAPLLCCFSFTSKPKPGDIINTGLCMNYQTLNNLRFKPLLKNSFQNIRIDLRDTSGEKLLFLSVGMAGLFSMFSKASNIHF